MKAGCYLHITFRTSVGTFAYIEIDANVSIPALPSDEGKNEVCSGCGGGGDDLYTLSQVRSVRFIARKGVWKSKIILEKTEVDSMDEWREVKERIADIFLPGYTFRWSGLENEEDNTEKPATWFPKELSVRMSP